MQTFRVEVERSDTKLLVVNCKRRQEYGSKSQFPDILKCSFRVAFQPVYFILLLFYSLCECPTPHSPPHPSSLCASVSLSLFIKDMCQKWRVFSSCQTHTCDRYPEVGMVVSVNWIAEQVVPWMRAGQIVTPDNLKTYMLQVHNVQVTDG